MSGDSPKREKPPESHGPVSFRESIIRAVPDVLSFVVGAGILYDQVVVEKQAQTLLVLAGLAALNVPVSRVAQRALERWLEKK